MAQEFEEALKSNGSNEVNLTAAYNIEFTEGRTKKNGKWIKTGKFYWIYTKYKDGKRQRISPTQVHGKIRFLTRLENCPHKGRVNAFLRNNERAAIRIDTEDSNGCNDLDRGLQSVEGTIFDKSASRK
jgi:hypothetical protein